LTLEKNAYKIE